MGTSGAYKGSGGKDAKALRDAVADYVDLDSSTPAAATSLDAAALRRVINLIRPRTQGGQGGDGPGVEAAERGAAPKAPAGAAVPGARRRHPRAPRGAPQQQRTPTPPVTRPPWSASVWTTTSCAAWAMTSRCCAASSTAPARQPDSTIEDHEQRLVAAEVAEWVLAQEREGTELTPEQIVRQAIATIISVTLLVETGELINTSNHADLVEREIRDAAEALAAQATLSAEGASEAELSQAVESGLETIRGIVKGGD